MCEDGARHMTSVGGVEGGAAPPVNRGGTVTGTAVGFAHGRESAVLCCGGGQNAGLDDKQRRGKDGRFASGGN